MSITREQVADLQPGDVVEFSGHPLLKGATLHGPLYESGDGGELSVGDYVVRYRDGRPNLTYADRMSVLLVSRAPRPLYVNHPRTEPVPGDVMRDASGVRPHHFVYSPTEQWVGAPWLYFQDGRSIREMPRRMPDRLRLLVDGETGQVVPS